MQTALYGAIGWKHPRGIFQVLEWARRFGWHAVDARGMTLGIPGDPLRNSAAFGYDMLGPCHIHQSARVDIRSACEESGIPILCLYVAHPVNLRGELGDANRKMFREYIQLAADLNIESVRAINNTRESYDDEPFSEEEAFERTMTGLQDVGKLAGDLGIGILIENNENSTTSCADELLEIQNAVRNVCRVGIAYDPVNAYFQGLNEFDELTELSGSVDFLHLKNVKRHHDPQFAYMPRGDFSYEWTSLSDGDISWETVLREAVEGGFDGTLTFEYVNPFKGMSADYWETIRDPEQAAQEERNYLNELIESIQESESERNL
ncbi:Xylose isomerase-like TIM barrel [Thalassoglobus neptunius]|uniref:Xylose isomerase-like TIM barrel n=1 Tax=Thalassoglobus neptunius TaxID=1938619 RepID=A0A5C5X587_9PLAN|nr:TIM barrel protein [Thalassoglobus neptunius]TWT57182.1 Xylose isomerase-like TIM barrel [Thalassoglobus neptunius]